MKQSVRRIGLVAGREFLAAVMNKGFVIGLLLMPAIIALLVVVFPRLMNRNVPPVRGEVAVIDPTGQVATELRAALAPDAIAARRRDSATRALQNAPEVVRDAATSAIRLTLCFMSVLPLGPGRSHWRATPGKQRRCTPLPPQSAQRRPRA